MSLTLTLAIIPGQTNWVASAKLRETTENSQKEIYCQKELAWKMKLTGAEVTSVMTDLGMTSIGSMNNWVAGYDLSITKTNRVIALELLKSEVLNIVSILYQNFGLDLHTYVTTGRESKYMGTISSSSFRADLQKWQG